MKGLAPAASRVRMLPMRGTVALVVLAALAVSMPAEAAKKVRRATKLSEAPTIQVENQRVKGRSQRPMVVIEIPRVPPSFDVGTSHLKRGARKLPQPHR